MAISRDASERYTLTIEALLRVSDVSFGFGYAGRTTQPVGHGVPPVAETAKVARTFQYGVGDTKSAYAQILWLTVGK
jgi:hypothetical protein